MENAKTEVTGTLAGITPARLFLGSCFALIATSVNFAVVAAIMGALKEQFVLSNLQVGAIAGAATFGFTISIFIFGPLCSALGMRFLLRLAFACHFLGVMTMMLASSVASGSYEMLYFGALIISMANGLVEAACNPLVATIYPTRKTQMLNRFHVWFPGGIVIGGLLCQGLDSIKLVDWRIKLVLILIPTMIYGVLFLGQKFPATERAQSGVSFGGMFKECLSRPFFWLLLLCMCMTASMELGPQRWVPSVLQAGGIPGILILVWVTGLMAVMRQVAGPIVHKLSPTGVLICSAILGSLGLFLLSHAQSGAAAFGAATVFAVGVCYFWPTMIGVTSERIPKGGELALALMGGMGMLIVGWQTTPLMGGYADKYVNQQLAGKPAEVKQVFERAAAEYPKLQAAAQGDVKKDFDPGIMAAKKSLAAIALNAGKATADVATELREVIKSAPASAVAEEANKVLMPADNFGGRMSFRAVAPLGIVLAIIFGLVFLVDRMKGGYKAEQLGPTAASPAPRREKTSV